MIADKILPTGIPLSPSLAFSEPLKPIPQNNIYILRHRKSLTLTQLSELTSISPSYLSRLENGYRRLNTDHLQKLSHALHCPVTDILNIPEIKKNPHSPYEHPANDPSLLNKELLNLLQQCCALLSQLVANYHASH